MSSDEDHQRLVIHFMSICAFCDSSLWLEKWLGFGGDLTIVCGAFAVKHFLKSDTVAGLTRILSLKWCKILVCFRNFNYEIFVVLNLAALVYNRKWPRLSKVPCMSVCLSMFIYVYLGLGAEPQS